MSTRSSLVACALSLAAVTAAQPLDAATTTTRGDGYVDNDDGTTATIVVGVIGQGGDPTAVSADSPSLPRLVRYRAEPANDLDDPLANLCDAGTGPFTGWWYTVTAISVRTGTEIGDPSVRCVPLPNPADPRLPPPPALPDPPTAGEVWRAADLPVPHVGVSPPVDGVTGLETWLWASSGATTVTIAATLDGFTVTGTARLVGYRFDLGDGPGAVVTTGPDGGTEHAPAARHTYETKGAYSIAVHARWEADFTMTGPGLSRPVVLPDQQAQLRVTRPYRVVEIRTTLVR